MREKERKVEIKPDERDPSEIIKALKANVKHGIHMLNPDACFTKGQMMYLIEVLERELVSIERAKHE